MARAQIIISTNNQICIFMYDMQYYAKKQKCLRSGLTFIESNPQRNRKKVAAVPAVIPKDITFYGTQKTPVPIAISSFAIIILYYW